MNGQTGLPEVGANARWRIASFWDEAVERRFSPIPTHLSPSYVNSFGGFELLLEERYESKRTEGWWIFKHDVLEEHWVAKWRVRISIPAQPRDDLTRESIGGRVMETNFEQPGFPAVFNSNGFDLAVFYPIYAVDITNDMLVSAAEEILVTRETDRQRREAANDLIGIYPPKSIIGRDE